MQEVSYYVLRNTMKMRDRHIVGIQNIDDLINEGIVGTFDNIRLSHFSKQKLVLWVFSLCVAFSNTLKFVLWN